MEFELTTTEVLELIHSAPRLRMAVRGWVAEEHLTRALERDEGVSEVRRLEAEGGPDVQVIFQGVAVTIECKNVLRKTNASGLPRLDFQRTRASMKDPCSRYYAPTDFQIVAACLHAVTDRWEFRFRPTFELAPHPRCPDRLDHRVRVDARWTSDPGVAMAALLARSPLGAA